MSFSALKPSTGSSASIASARASIQHLSDPDARFVDSHAFDALCMEMLDIVIEAASVAHTRQKARERLVEQHYQLAHQSVATLLAKSLAAEDEETVAPGKVDEPLVRTRLETIGYRIGWCLAERLSRDKAPLPRPLPPANSPAGAPPPPPEPLEAVKFVCKDIWMTMHDKQIDNLRTNHRGVFVLQDNAHKPLMRLSGIADDPASHQAWVLRAERALYMPCGVIRGALACFGINGVATAELGGGTQCTFQFKQAKS